jgi:uncharacterized protein YkwD
MNLYTLTLLFIITFNVSFSQSVPKETGSKVTQAEAQQALDYHNKVRKEVGTPPLAWSTELAEYAQAWADNLARNNCKFEHRPSSGEWKQIHGENIFWGSGTSYSALDASESWYSEIKDYKHGPISDANWPVAGHYTQMVWKNTTQVGIGTATCRGGEILIVANYDPSGNYWGEKAY